MRLVERFMCDEQALSSQSHDYNICSFVGDTSWFGERFNENLAFAEILLESIPMRDRVASVRGNVRKAVGQEIVDFLA